MRSFFTAIFFIGLSGLVLILYYGLKFIINRRSVKNREENIKKKLYEDEKTFFREYLKTLLPKLKKGEIQWLLIFSRLFPDNKIEITYNAAKKAIHVFNRGRQILPGEEEKIMNFGANSYMREDEAHLVRTPLNSKIISDIIYYLFEIIHGQEKAVNLKIKTSGE